MAQKDFNLIQNYLDLPSADKAGKLFTVHWRADSYLAHEAASHALVVVAAFHHLALHEVGHPLLAQTQCVASLRTVHVVTCRSSSKITNSPISEWTPSSSPSLLQRISPAGEPGLG